MSDTPLEQAASKGIDEARPTIETFPNQFRGVGYIHTITIEEFTSICPKTGMPDFGEVTVEYIADKLCLELKSLKYYFYSFRNRGIFYENLINVITTDLVKACWPNRLEVNLSMTPRGGIHSKLRLIYRQSDADEPGTWAYSLVQKH